MTKMVRKTGTALLLAGMVASAVPAVPVHASGRRTAAIVVGVVVVGGIIVASSHHKHKSSGTGTMAPAKTSSRYFDNQVHARLSLSPSPATTVTR